MGAHQQRVVGIAEHRDIGDGQRPDRLAVVAVAQADEFALVAETAVLPAVETHLQRDLDGRRAIAREEGVTQRAASACRQSLGQLHRRRVGTAGQHHVFQRVQLVLESGIDACVGVAEQIDPPGAGGVEVARAFEVFQPRPVRPRDGDRRHLAHALHLRARVPHAGHAALLPRGVHGNLRWTMQGSRHVEGRAVEPHYRRPAGSAWVTR